MDKTKYFIGDNTAVAFSRKYLDHEDLTASQVYADNTAVAFSRKYLDHEDLTASQVFKYVYDVEPDKAKLEQKQQFIGALEEYINGICNEKES